MLVVTQAGHLVRMKISSQLSCFLKLMVPGNAHFASEELERGLFRFQTVICINAGQSSQSRLRMLVADSCN
jgi:hypothetical protein